MAPRAIGTGSCNKTMGQSGRKCGAGCRRKGNGTFYLLCDTHQGRSRQNNEVTVGRQRQREVNRQWGIPEPEPKMDWVPVSVREYNWASLKQQDQIDVKIPLEISSLQLIKGLSEDIVADRAKHIALSVKELVGKKVGKRFM